MKKLILSLVFGIAVITSCKNDDPVPTTATFSFNVGFTGNSSSFLNFSTGEIVLTEIVWDGTLEGSTLPTSVTHSVVTTIDVATGVANPAIPVIEISPGKYSKISMGIELWDNGVDANIILEGIFTHSDASTFPIKFIFDSGEVFETTLASLTIAPGSNTLCTLNLNPILWFANITQSELEEAALSSGTIVLSESSNAALYDKVEEAILNATTDDTSISCN
ncbi:MAG: hypothetical protein IIB82_06670 [Bacteroidetes bacterium]|nr:hypothetical protein [Bacteroidota bacterium]